MFRVWLSPNEKNPFSVRFQWLPFEAGISGDEARITFYINNLHPQKEKPLYDLISKLITACIPLWDLSLAPLRSSDFLHRRRIPCSSEVVYDPDPEEGPEGDEPQQGSDEDEDDRWDRRNKRIEDTKTIKETFGQQGLQVIVKLANIQLTPEKPEYEGGSWHAEGLSNEHIVAVSLYYYSSSNITSSTLSFRQQCFAADDCGVPYNHKQHEWIKNVFGFYPNGHCIQEIGHVETREGLLLTFPNILQHRVDPFKLQDPTKPGHCEIVALFLVDPNFNIISTAHVACQRQDWWWEMLRSSWEKQDSHSSGSKSKGMASLPRELQDQIEGEIDDMKFPMSLLETKRLRLELMEERKKYLVTAFKRSPCADAKKVRVPKYVV